MSGGTAMRQASPGKQSGRFGTIGWNGREDEDELGSLRAVVSKGERKGSRKDGA